MAPKYIRKKNAQPKEIWLYTEALWLRGDFMEVPVDEAETLLGIRQKETVLVVSAAVEEIVEEIIEASVEVSPELPANETPSRFTLKRGAYRRYDVLDAFGNVVAKSLLLKVAEAKIVELSA